MNWTRRTLLMLVFDIGPQKQVMLVLLGMASCDHLSAGSPRLIHLISRVD